MNKFRTVAATMLLITVSSVSVNAASGDESLDSLINDLVATSTETTDSDTMEAVTTTSTNSEDGMSLEEIAAMEEVTTTDGGATDTTDVMLEPTDAPVDWMVEPTTVDYTTPSTIENGTSTAGNTTSTVATPKSYASNKTLPSAGMAETVLLVLASVLSLAGLAMYRKKATI